MLRRCLVCIIFLFLIVLTSGVFSSASLYNIEINQVGERMLVKHSALLDEEGIISFNLPADAYSISSRQEYSLDKDIITIKSNQAEISYLTEEALQKSGEGFYFVEKIKFNFDVDVVILKFTLDTGHFLDKEMTFPPVSSMETDGRQISAIWRLNDIKKGDDLPIFLQIGYSESADFSLLVLIGIIFIAIAIYLFYHFYQKKSKKEDIDRHLMESEKMIIQELKKADRGELWQKRLQLNTNFSKAKISRLIRNLEQRNLIEKIPFGNTNKVRLK